MKETLILGIDIGTTNAKALLATPTGKTIAQATATYPLYTPRSGWTEQNPEDWWQGAVAVAARVMTESGARPEQVAAVGISGQGAGAVLVDGAGMPVRPGIIWMDARSEAQCQFMRERAGERLLAINGKQPGPYNTDPKLIWLQEHEPDVLRRASTCLTTTGYINMRLTGERVLNVSDASIPFAFDQAACDWSDELIEAFGIERSLYPRVAPCQQVIGQVTPEAASAMHLKAGTPVIAGGEDTSSAGLAVGVHRPGQTMLSLGTGGSIYIAQDKPLAHPQLLTFAHVLEKQWFVGGTIVAFGASLAWCRDLLNQHDFNDLTARAAESEPGAGGLLFLPYLSGELQPINDGHARGVFFGLSLNTRQPQLIRAVMEGVAFSMMHNIQVAREVGATVSELRAVGGPTRSTLWCQIIADITHQPLVVLKDNAGAPLGDVLLAAAGVGLIPDAGLAAAQAAQIERGVSAEPGPPGNLRPVVRHLPATLSSAQAAVRRAGADLAVSRECVVYWQGHEAF
ncbi:MAG: xylulokinase [Chloroflexi bacterium]|nr:xylulokinase [Chloroflexota bacterium]